MYQYHFSAILSSPALFVKNYPYFLHTSIPQFSSFPSCSSTEGLESIFLCFRLPNKLSTSFSPLSGMFWVFLFSLPCFQKLAKAIDVICLRFAAKG